MTLTPKVMWKEGMFLRPHHFQQQDRRLESLLTSRLAAMQPFHWGFSQLEIDPAALEAGRFGLLACAGAFPDGTPFAAPADDSRIAPVDIPADAKQQTVWLTMPVQSLGAALAMNDDGNGPVPSRYAIRVHEVADLLKEGNETQPMELGSPNLGLVLGERPEGYDALPAARVVEVSAGRVRLDPEFSPPVLAISASERLTKAVGEVAARFQVRADYLAGPLGTAGGLGAGALQQLMLLQLCSGKGALFAHHAATGNCHPEVLFRTCVETAAELAAFTDRDKRRPPPLPDYDHDAPAACFGPVIELILRYLGSLEEPEAVQLPLEFHQGQRIYYNRSLDSALLESARFFVVASARMEEEEFRTAFPANVSIGSTGEILQIMGAAGRSVRLRPMPHFPPEIRQLSGWVCFELDRNSPSWEGVRNQMTIAVHAQDVFDDLKIQLWAVRD